jgi:exonuclease VII large subunit
LSIIAGGAAFYGIAQSALGNIKSRFDQAKGMVGNLKNTAEGLKDRFNDVQGQLNKDALEGKVNQLSDAAGNLKSSVKSKIPRIKAQLKQEIEEKKKKLKRKPKDPKAKKKFTLQNFELPSLPPIPQPPTLPDANSIGNLAGVPTTPDAALAASGLNSNSVSSIVNSTNIEVPTLPSLSTSTSTSTSTSFSSTTTNSSTNNTAGTNLQLTKYQTNATVGYGVGKSQDENMARQIANFQATQDLAKKLNKSRLIGAGEFDSKTYLLNGNIYQVEVAIREN